MKKIVDVIFINYLNENNRIYDLKSCNAILDCYKKKTGIIYGELNHPDSFDVSLQNTSHIIDDMWLDNNILKAKIITLNNKQGKKLEKNIDKMVFSCRSLGHVDPDTNIVDIHEFVTIDAINWKEDAYIKIRLREKKLKRILNEK